jgi:hypothetical protein
MWICKHQHFGGKYFPLDGGGMFLWNIVIYLQVQKTLQLRRPTSTSSPPRNLISRCSFMSAILQCGMSVEQVYIKHLSWLKLNGNVPSQQWSHQELPTMPVAYYINCHWIFNIFHLRPKPLLHIRLVVNNCCISNFSKY